MNEAKDVPKRITRLIAISGLPALVLPVLLAAGCFVPAGIYTPSTGEIALRAISDGSGGVVVAWQDEDNIYAQRVGPEGKPLWAEGSVLVCAEPMQASQVALTSDGSGGAIISWNDRSHRSDDQENAAYFAPIYSQKIDAKGEPLWGEQGIPTGSRLGYARVISDGTGGAIVTWRDSQPVFRSLYDDYVRLQKIAPEGNPLWGEKGILLCSSPPYRPVTPEEKESGLCGTSTCVARRVTPEERERGLTGWWTRSLPAYTGYHKATSDGSGGAIVIWSEELEGVNANIYAQRVDAEGMLVWQGNGILVCTAEYSHNIEVTSDGMGGAIITWVAYTGCPELFHAQRIDASGKLLWSEGGVSLWKQCPQVVSDGLGGAVFLEQGQYPTTGYPGNKQASLYAQRLDYQGQNLWQEKPLFATEKGQWWVESAIASDGTGGALIAWRTWTEKPKSLGEDVCGGKVYAQKLDAAGNPLWPEEAIAVFNDPALKYQGPPQVVSDGSGGAIVVAAAGRNAVRGDMVYVQRLDAEGNCLWGDKGIRLNS